MNKVIPSIRSRDAEVVAAINPHALGSEDLVALVRNTHMWAKPELRKTVKVEANKHGVVSFTFRIGEASIFGEATLNQVATLFDDAIAELREEKKVLLVFRELSVFRNNTCVMEYAYHP